MSRDAGGTEDRLDAAIDRAVREMLDVEPPAGLRGRVLARIDLSSSSRSIDSGSRSSVASAFRRKSGWLAASVAAAAIALAIVIPRSNGLAPSTPLRPIAVAVDHRLPQPGSSAEPLTPGVGPRPALAASARPRTGARGLVIAAVTVDTDVAFTEVAALPGPVSIAIERLTEVPRPVISGLGVGPLEIRALEVTPLAETPQERREE